MKVLVVGPGALGQVFGTHLQIGGAQVDVMVKPARRQEAAQGFRLWRVRRFRDPIEVRFVPEDVVVVAELAQARWDLVLLCVPSTALDESLLAPLAAVLGEATLASITQGVEDARLLARFFPKEQTVLVVPASTLAWSGPLADETPGPGTAYWLAPASALLVGGAEARARLLVAAFRNGGLGARYVRTAGVRGLYVAAASMPYIAALELAGWSVTALQRSPWLKVATAAAREAMSALNARDGVRRPLVPRSVGLARLGLRMAPAFVPFDLERYLQRHFSKVSAQTWQMLREWSALGRTQQTSVHALGELLAARGTGEGAAKTAHGPDAHRHEA